MGLEKIRKAMPRGGVECKIRNDDGGIKVPPVAVGATVGSGIILKPCIRTTQISTGWTSVVSESTSAAAPSDTLNLLDLAWMVCRSRRPRSESLTSADDHFELPHEAS
jgi:hypothetical protein